MNDLASRAYRATIVFADGLVPQADPENGHLAATQSNQLYHATGLVRRSRAGG